MSGIQPVFVFEGKPPALKREVMLKRMRARYDIDINFKKLARKLILDQLRKKKPPSEAPLPQENTNDADLAFPDIDNELFDELMASFEEVYEAEERREAELEWDIFYKENLEIIQDNGYKLEEFKQLDHPLQRFLVEGWKKNEDKNRFEKLKEMNNPEDVSKQQLANLVKNAKKQMDLQKYKDELNQKLALSGLDNLGLDNLSKDNLLMLCKMDWRREKTIFLFGARTKEGAVERDSLFQQKQRISKKQRINQIIEDTKVLGAKNFKMDLEMTNPNFVDQMIKKCSNQLMKQEFDKYNLQKETEILEGLDIVPENVENEYSQQKVYEEAKNAGNGQCLDDLISLDGESGSGSSFGDFLANSGNKPNEISNSDRIRSLSLDSNRDKDLSLPLQPQEEFIQEKLPQILKHEEIPSFYSKVNISSMSPVKNSSSESRNLDQMVKKAIHSTKSISEYKEIDDETIKINSQLLNWLEDDDLDGKSVSAASNIDKEENVEKKSNNIFQFFSGGFERPGTTEEEQELHQKKLRELINKSRKQNQDSKPTMYDLTETESNSPLKLLLQLFGIPWIESPTEAEAQCAKLEVSSKMLIL